MSGMREKQGGKQPQRPEDEFPRQPPLFPLPICPKCRSNNTIFCHSPNPRCYRLHYLCKNCGRFFIHGRALQQFLIGETSTVKQATTEGQSSSSGNGAGPSSLSPQVLQPPPPRFSTPSPTPINPGLRASGSYPGGGDFNPRRVDSAFGSAIMTTMRSFGCPGGQVNRVAGQGGVGEARVGGWPRGNIVFVQHSVRRAFRPQLQGPLYFTYQSVVQQISRTTNAANVAEVLNTSEWEEPPEMETDSDSDDSSRTPSR